MGLNGDCDVGWGCLCVLWFPGWFRDGCLRLLLLVRVCFDCLLIVLFAFDLCIVVGLLFWDFGRVNFVFGLLLVLVVVVCVIVWLF